MLASLHKSDGTKAEEPCMKDVSSIETQSVGSLRSAGPSIASPQQAPPCIDVCMDDADVKQPDVDMTIDDKPQLRLPLSAPVTEQAVLDAVALHGVGPAVLSITSVSLMLEVALSSSKRTSRDLQKALLLESLLVVHRGAVRIFYACAALQRENSLLDGASLIQHAVAAIAKADAAYAVDSDPTADDVAALHPHKLQSILDNRNARGIVTASGTLRCTVHEGANAYAAFT